MQGKTLYFVRHGEAGHNVHGSANDVFDPPLTAKGKEQVKVIQGSVDLVIVSSMLRAKQTLLGSNLFYSRVIETPLVREWTIYGHASLKANEAHLLENKERDHDFVDRCRTAIKFIRRQSAKTIAIVAHGVSNAQIIRELTGKNVGFANAQVISVASDGTIK